MWKPIKTINSDTVIKINLLLNVYFEKVAEWSFDLFRTAHDMTSRTILGLSVGMPEEAVGKVIESFDGVRVCETKTTYSKRHTEAKRVRAVYVDFDDERFIGINLSETDYGNCLSEIWLVHQGKSLVGDLWKKTIREYGRPDFRKLQGGITLAAWGGRATDQGAVVRHKDVFTTLSVEQVNNRQFTLRLVGHRILAEEI